MARKFCVVDAEGDRGRMGLLGVAFYSDICQDYITDHDEIREQLLIHARKSYTFVAHNAEYDLSVIWWQLGLKARAIYYNKTFNRGEWLYREKGSSAQIWDSFNLSGNLSLAQLGRSINLPKLATPQVLTGKDPDRYKWFCDTHKRGECVECYAIRDAEIVYKFLALMTDTLAGWGVRPQRRIAGAATAVWKALDNPSPISLNDGRIRHLARQSYFGGRVEPFKLGHFAPIYTADVASMYPSVMLETPFPDPSSMVYVVNPSPSRYPLELEGVCECLISIPHMYIPPLPSKQAGLRAFGIGLQRGVWTHPELRYALTLGARVVKIYRGAYAETSFYPFTTFISTLWEGRQAFKAAQDPRMQTYKILLNSCYGRLGMDTSQECEVVEPFDPRKRVTDYHGAWLDMIDGEPYIRHSRPDSMDHTWQNVLWASYITATARIKLHRYLSLQSDSVVYCDTDSVFSMAPITGLGTGLGALTDPESYGRGWIVGPKLYSLEREQHDYDPEGVCLYCRLPEREARHQPCHFSKAKGVPRHLALRFLQGESVQFETPVKPRSQGRTGELAGTWISVSRERRLAPLKRQPTTPLALTSDYGWSDTLPPLLGPLSAH